MMEKVAISMISISQESLAMSRRNQVKKIKPSNVGNVAKNRVISYLMVRQ
jgi:hypothetical protein